MALRKYVTYQFLWGRSTKGSRLFLSSKTRVRYSISPVSFLWDIAKPCRPRPDAAECGVWLGSQLFAYRIFYQNLNKNEKYHPTTITTEMDWSN